MIKVEYLTDCEGVDRYGTCASCGTNSHADDKMVRMTFSLKLSDNTERGTSICLCDKCRRALYEKIEISNLKPTEDRPLVEVEEARLTTKKIQRQIPRHPYCEDNKCPWYDGRKCNSPNYPAHGQCDFDWAERCPECGKLIAISDGGECPYCGAELNG